jgi:hypothetical protein
MNELTLAFAGCRVRVNGLLPTQTTVLRTRLEDLAVREEGEPDAEVDVHFTPSPEGFMRRPRGATETRIGLIHHPSHVAAAGIGFRASVERRPVRAQLHTCLNDARFASAFDNVLRIVASYLLFDRGGLVLHSAAITEGELSFLFCGRSGAGKTTLCSLAHELEIDVWSDELNAVIPFGDGFALQDLPFVGDVGQVARARLPSPLTAVFDLEHGTEPSLRECSKAEAVSRIVAACPYLNTDPAREDELNRRAERLVDAASFRVLTFAKRTNFWSVLTREYGALGS